MKTMILLTFADGKRVIFKNWEDLEESLSITHSQLGEVQRTLATIGTRVYGINGIEMARGQTVEFMDRADHL